MVSKRVMPKSIQDAVKKIFVDACERYTSQDLEFDFGEDWFSVTDMYDPPTVNADTLMKLVKVLKIEPEQLRFDMDIEQGGCETCDYGSKYGYTFRIDRARG